MPRKKSRGPVENWFDLNIDEDTRTIYMGSISKTADENESGVDNFMAEYFIKGMHILNTTSDEPITIVMNNPGGDWYHGMAIYDAISTSPSHCTIMVYGHAMSMGSVILQAADKRYMMPNSRFMIHYGSDGKIEHSKTFEKWADESKRLNWEMENIYIRALISKDIQMGGDYIVNKINEIMKITRALEMPMIRKDYVLDDSDILESMRSIVKDMLNFDTILTAQQTVDLGFADEIVSRFVNETIS